MRDLGAVASKFYHVLYPKSVGRRETMHLLRISHADCREKKSLLKEWDLWGPLILCTLMATILQVC